MGLIAFHFLELDLSAPWNEKASETEIQLIDDDSNTDEEATGKVNFNFRKQKVLSKHLIISSADHRFNFGGKK